MTSLDDSVQYIKGVGPKRLEVLERLGVNTVRELLFFLPRDYEDRTHVTPIERLRVGERATVKGAVLSVRKYRARNGRPMAEVVVEDDTGRLKCVWFKATYFQESRVPEGREHAAGLLGQHTGRPVQGRAFAGEPPLHHRDGHGDRHQAAHEQRPPRSGPAGHGPPGGSDHLR